MRKYNGFEDLLRDFETNDPEADALLQSKGGMKTAVSRKEFAFMARERAKELAEEKSTCLGILCDGSPECVLTIFGSVLSGKQTVLLNENVMPFDIRTENTRRSRAGASPHPLFYVGHYSRQQGGHAH